MVRQGAPKGHSHEIEPCIWTTHWCHILDRSHFTWGKGFRKRCVYFETIWAFHGRGSNAICARLRSRSALFGFCSQLLYKSLWGSISATGSSRDVYFVQAIFSCEQVKNNMYRHFPSPRGSPPRVRTSYTRNCNSSTISKKCCSGLSWFALQSLRKTSTIPPISMQGWGSAC